MQDHFNLILIAIAVVIVVLVIGPLRKLAAWLIVSGSDPAWQWIKVAMHILIGSHATVIRNFKPRQSLIYELDKKRTSHTNKK